MPVERGGVEKSRGPKAPVAAPRPAANRPADVFMFEDRRTSRPVVLEAPQVNAVRSPAIPATSYPRPSDVDAIVAMKDPTERNYAITQGYHDLSNALAGVLGKENATWATFGAYASRQAGVTIRGEDVPALFRGALEKASGPAHALAKVDDLLRKYGLPALPLADVVAGGADAMAEMSDAIADGNRYVFNEIGREFAVFVDTFQGATHYDAAKVERYLAHFPPEQHLLRDAFAHYARAQFEADPNKKAEQMLAGNALIGLHEQTQLQPFIERALGAPVETVFRRVIGESLDAVFNKSGFLGRLLREGLRISGALDKVEDSAVQGLSSTFRRVATERMMTLALPDVTLRLGEDMPPGPDGQVFPEPLRTIQSPELQAVLAKVDQTPDTLKGTRADDWSSLEQRMNFIVDLFRSRQQDPSLRKPPLEGRTGRYPVSEVLTSVV
jgi:hypothetical protein